MSEETIDVNDEQALHDWAGKLDASPSQVKDAVDAVGARAADVEQHLKGVRSTTNSERTTDNG